MMAARVGNQRAESVFVLEDGSEVDFNLLAPDTRFGEPLGNLETAEERARAFDFTDLLTSRQCLVLMYYYRSGLTLSAIGQLLGVTRERVRQIKLEAILTLREAWRDRVQSD